MSHKLVVGFITYGEATAEYLPYFLSSLKEQTHKDFKILAVDNTEEPDNENIKYLKENYPEIEIDQAGENLGFARAYNRMIKKAVVSGGQYFLALNPDMLLASDFVEKMVGVMEKDSALGSASPKILKWDFGRKDKTNIIDTCGIKLRPGLRFVDLGQGKIDDGSFDRAEILGPSGAAAIYSLGALEKVKQGDQYFDELFFMYKEDCDLALRLNLAGYKSGFVPGAVIYHNRSASSRGDDDLAVALNRKNKSKQVKKWSFWGQQLIFMKYWKKISLFEKLHLIWYELKMVAFILLFERYLLSELLKLWKVRAKIIVYKK